MKPRRKRPPPLALALRRYVEGADREATVKAIATALDLLSPFEMIPVFGGIIESATDELWTPAAQAIVEGIERAIKRAEAKG